MQTVPWREQPIVYHHLSIRRWLTKPLNYVPYPGVKAHIGDNHRWLDGQRQAFCFIPLMMNRYGREVKWPQAISNLFSLNDSQLPDANNFVSFLSMTLNFLTQIISFLTQIITGQVSTQFLVVSKLRSPTLLN